MSEKEIINTLKDNANLENRENVIRFEETPEILIETKFKLSKLDIVELIMILNDENPHQLVL